MKLRVPGRVIVVLLLACVVAIGTLVTTAAAMPSPPRKAPASSRITPLNTPPSDDQCVNGQVGPPLATTPCLNGTLGPTTYVGWVPGHAGLNDAHWAEGEFVPYRVVMPGLSATEHTLVFAYSTIVWQGGAYRHAFDYLGDYDATERTTPVPSVTHRNNNNPCTDVTGAVTDGWCTSPGIAPTPATADAVPPADLSGQQPGCPVTRPQTVPTQLQGDFKLFAPGAAHAAITDAQYLRQNYLSGGNTCYTEVQVKFTLDSPGTVVLAFGGHIASSLDWGRGNVAAGTNTTYSMRFETLDGNAEGLGRLTLSARAIARPPVITTHLSHSQITAGTPVTDLAVASVGSYGRATGQVRFRLCANQTTGCPQGTGTPIGPLVPLVNGQAPSGSFGDGLPAGHYCVGVDFHADENSYYSDGYYDGPSECFTIRKAGPSISTYLEPNPVKAGDPVHDTAELIGATPDARGTVEFHRFPTLLACEAATGAFPGHQPSRSTLVSSHSVTGDTVGSSTDVSVPRPGESYWAAFYSGDGRNYPAVSICQTEHLKVQWIAPSIITHLSPNPVAVNELVHDTAELIGTYADAEGTVRFRRYDSLDACKADTAGFPVHEPSRGVHVGTEPVVGGTAGPSGAARFPRPGLHWWAAFYSGDTVHDPVASDCDTETVAVTAAGPTLTVVKTASVRGFHAAGVVITYYYRVTNVGPVPLHGIRVTDSRGLRLSCPATALAPLEAMTCTARHTVTAGDVKSGGITNTGTAEGTAPDGTRVRGSSRLRLPFTGRRLPPVPVTG